MDFSVRDVDFDRLCFERTERGKDGVSTADADGTDRAFATDFNSVGNGNSDPGSYRNFVSDRIASAVANFDSDADTDGVTDTDRVTDTDSDTGADGITDTVRKGFISDI